MILTIFMVFGAAPAQAQATRTWVSGVGDDANPCSRTAPCKTFAGAISKTAAHGQIDCLDPGGFGAVTITKSITIICEEETGHILVSGTPGITVSGTTASDIVTLRGLDIDGITTGTSGINFIGAGTLHVEECLIRGFNGFGINFVPNGSASLVVDDTIVSDNGNTSGFSGGILVQPTAGDTIVSLDRVRLTNNAFGLDADGSSASSVHVAVADSLASANANSGFIAETTGPRTTMIIDHTRSTNNGTNGIKASGGNAALFIGGSTVYGNGTGVSIVGGATLLSYKDNRIDLNSSNGTPVPQANLN